MKSVPKARNGQYREIVERFDTVIRADAEAFPYIKDICRVVGYTQRTLARAFRAVHGTTPSRYLRTLRLMQAREALLSVDAEALTVTKVALRFGFRELGRFAVDYRATFGESPSQTLRRAKAISNGPRIERSGMRVTK